MPDLKKPALLLALLLAAVVTGCTNPTPGVPTPAATAVFTSPLAPQPASGGVVATATKATSALVSPLATPARPAGAAVPPESPTANVLAKGMGAATGTLQRLDGSPIRGGLVYAALIEQHNGIKLAAVDAVKDPRVTTDRTGSFALIGLVPGEYSLVMQSPWGMILLENDSGVPVRFTATAGQVTQVGLKLVKYEYPDD